MCAGGVVGAVELEVDRRRFGRVDQAFDRRRVVDVRADRDRARGVGFDRRFGLFDDRGLALVAAGAVGFLVVFVAGVVGDPVVGAGQVGGEGGRFVFAVALVDRDVLAVGAVQRFMCAGGVVGAVELEVDRRRFGRVDQAFDRRRVVDVRADRDRARGFGFDRRFGLFDDRGLAFVAAGAVGFLVVFVAGVVGDPVVGAGLVGGEVGRFVVAVALVDRDVLAVGAVQRFMCAGGVVGAVELEVDRRRFGRVDQAFDRRRVVDVRADRDRARGVGFDRRFGLFDDRGLAFVAAGAVGFLVVFVAGVVWRPSGRSRPGGW